MEHESDGIPIVIGALSTVPKGLVNGLDELEISGRAETIQTTTLLRSTTILRVLETCGGHFLQFLTTALTNALETVGSTCLTKYNVHLTAGWPLR